MKYLRYARYCVSVVWWCPASVCALYVLQCPIPTVAITVLAVVPSQKQNQIVLKVTILSFGGCLVLGVAFGLVFSNCPHADLGGVIVGSAFLVHGF